MKTSESKYCKCLYFTTNALARKVEKLALESWKPVDLSPSHAYLLMMVLEEPGLQPSCIANHLQLSPSTVTRLIEKLEEKNLVSRTTEGKSTKVYPTKIAKKLLPILQKCTDHFYTNYSNILGKDESSKLVTNMGLVADKLAV
ncbi:MAG: MarR family transcriptional regulator [Pedobacter sp.]|nr:MarR family transcriptional regulator [Chitinophagaceae bacterium]